MRFVAAFAICALATVTTYHYQSVRVKRIELSSAEAACCLGAVKPSVQW